MYSCIYVYVEIYLYCIPPHCEEHLSWSSVRAVFVLDEMGMKPLHTCRESAIMIVIQKMMHFNTSSTVRFRITLHRN